MRKLIESTLVSLDGVIGTPHQGANFDDEDEALAMEQLRNYDALELDRSDREVVAGQRVIVQVVAEFDGFVATQRCATIVRQREWRAREAQKE